ncbi:MAG: tetratricopeptide repeat protein [Methanoregulaceae archaeon]|jgi:tetratricopeptide (TPR) repeat protein|nr:tetratricopeptide repeat protein [Methanoregulaceae archaeon]
MVLKGMFVIVVILGALTCGCISSTEQVNNNPPATATLNPRPETTILPSTQSQPIPQSMSQEQVSYQKGLDLYQQGKYSDSIKEFNTTLSINPANGAAYLARGKAYYNIGKKEYYTLNGEDKFQLANSDLSSALEYNQDEEEIYNLLGWSNYYTGAITSWKHSYTDLGKHTFPFYENGIRNFSLALQKNPNNIEALYGRANLYSVIGEGTRDPQYQFDEVKMDLADKDIEAALKLDPHNGTALYYKVQISSGRRMPNEVLLKYFDEAIKYETRSPEFYRSRGAVKSNMHDYEGSKRDFDQALKMEPDYALVYHNYANLKSREKKYDEAIVASQKALNINSNISVFHSDFASYKFSNINIEICRAFLNEIMDSTERAIEIDQKNPDAHYIRYLCLLILNENVELQKEAAIYSGLAKTDGELKLAQAMLDVATSHKYLKLSC